MCLKISNFGTNVSRSSVRQLSLLLLLLTLILPASACEEIDPAECVPIDGDCINWLTDGELRTAYTFEELTEIINGGATFYWNYGFVGGAFQNYTIDLPENTVIGSISLYNLGTAENALALFNDPDSGSGEPVDDWSGSGVARLRVGFGVAVLEFQENCFFASILIMPGDETNAAEAFCPAGTVIARIQGSTPIENQTWGAIKHLFIQ